jgi:hypothetical protein
MNPRKFGAAQALLLIIVLLLVGVASASIISNVSQIGQAVSPQPNPGSFAISSMKGVNFDGNQGSIPSQMPANQVFVLTKVTMNFQATDTNLTDPVTLNVGDYYRMGFTLNGGFCAGSDNITPGIPIVNLGALVKVNKNSDPDKTAINGKLNLRLIGYTANLN